jgi:hypothetical protein
LNKWRLTHWRQLFQTVVPRPDEFLEKYDSAQEFASRLTDEEKAELDDYTKEELNTVDAIYLWQNPI